MERTNDPEVFAALTTEELRTLAGTLSSGGYAAAECRDPDLDTANELLSVSADLHHMARHRDEAEMGERELRLSEGRDLDPETLSYYRRQTERLEQEADTEADLTW